MYHTHHPMEHAVSFNVQQQLVNLRGQAGMSWLSGRTGCILGKDSRTLAFSDEERRKDTPVVTLANHPNIVGEVCYSLRIRLRTRCVDA